MRPIKLELKYIGPYENETINFEDINKTLFLISGKTGSGKSMIFDAITHALFATASTSVRGTESLRSQFAPSTEPSIITFTFMYRGKTYKVERRLRYFRGTNTTETPPESSIYDEFGELIENGLTKVTAFITELLQISASQFRQIGLLPQGEFRKFLVASSSDKEEILKALFRTERFNALYQKLKKDHDTNKQKLIMNHALIMNQFSQVLVDEEISTSFKENLELFTSKQEIAIKELKEKEINYAERLESKQELSNEILKIKENNDRVESYFNKKNNLETLLKQKSVIREKENRLNLTQKVLTIKDAYYSYKEYASKVSATEKLIDKTNDIYKERVAYQENIDRELEKISKNNSKIMSYKEKIKQISKFDNSEYQTIESELENLQKDIEKNNKTLVTKQEQLEALEKKIFEIDVTDTMLRTAEVDMYSLKERLFKIENELIIAKEVEQNRKEHNELIEKINLIKSEIDELTLNIEKQNNDVQSLDNIDIETINDMITHLEVGKPCVICQQTVSQIPDTLNYDVDLYRDLELKTKDLDAMEIKRLILSEKGFKEIRSSSEIESDISVLKDELSNYETEIIRIELELKRKHELESNLTELNSEVHEMIHILDFSNRDLESLNIRFKKFKQETNFGSFLEFKQSLTKMNSEIDAYESTLNKLESKKQELMVEVAKFESQLDSIQYKLYTERNILDENSKKVSLFLSEHEDVSLNDLESLFKADNDALKSEIESFHNEVMQVESLIEHIKKDIKSFEIVDLTEKLKEESKLSELINIESKLVGQLESKIKEYNATYNRIVNEIESYNHEESRFTELAKLVELLGGKQGTPTLSRFVLVYYLERILNQANIRLRKMTNGRYELRRAESYRSDQSLHIDVFDYFNNARRSVATLSGGESFQAALALALALSEIIQHESGSIDMDMLLIDEGFGTLDEQTLKVAIDTLFDLQKSGKMIGIISHVEELKSMIGNILYVETLDERSQTRLVTPLSN
ncbi:AAA family ATPase [Phocicoccus pinnipedialis]|uniref:Nuclease SbcCD subunit C n=1 Tax=Phocicoccus pinnipedialis TaxID=110845 RepID=A0A6V7RGJ5_9BACL|nr:SMC family ATPase [Jeotgalicoccus pinnipedialis]MBP1939188.1 exonuclease SbcC [Jeotgalicoccus pinnipedialis]CAD2076386.1 Nuclease SbcCD subunit C [Jeotgalicoccus pinnipedialis]